MPDFGTSSPISPFKAAAGTAVVGMILLGDTVSAAKLVSISLVLAEQYREVVGVEPMLTVEPQEHSVSAVDL